jgi:predicted AAA+ superfamily ATPase
MIVRLLTINTSSSFFLFGARGTGKTKLLESQFGGGNPLVIDLLLPRSYQQYLADPESLSPLIEQASKQKRLIIIDEVQRVPALLDLAHFHIERSGARFGLTGSSARKLRRGGANLLAGRAVTYHLFPFLVDELGDSFALAQALAYGTMPRPTLESSDEERILYLESYVDTYLQQEIVAEQVVRNLPPFRRFLSVAAQSNGKIVNYSNVARDCQTDDSNVRNYFQILEDTLLGFFLPAFDRSIRKQQRAAPKFYFIDTGIARGITGQLRSPLQTGTYDWGRLFESFVISQIRAGLAYQRSHAQLSYLRTKDNAEIDLIIERAGGDRTLCIEIKSGTILHPGELANLKSLALDLGSAKPICIYTGKEEQLFEGVEVLPFTTALRQILSGH